MDKEKPPLRADVVGSLLRPRRLLEAREKAARGELAAAALRAVEDECIREAVARQESVGLQVATDGEFRRTWWNHDFMGRLGGVEVVEDPDALRFVGTSETRLVSRVRARVHHAGPIAVGDFAYLRSVARVTPKQCIPAPAMLYYRGGRARIDQEVYPDLDRFWIDVASAYAEEIRLLHAAGCDYLQIDDTSHAFLCDERFRESCRRRGDDPERLPEVLAEALNLAIAGRPEGMSVVMHTCRGNWKSSWMAEGGYGPVAEAVFGRTRVDAYFLEYDTERAGGFEPLRFVPRGRKVVLGLVTTKTPRLETKDELRRRIDEAARYVPLEDLCISPQCGFASSVHGNALSEDDQWRKLERVVEVARAVWG
ncbi:MAG: 5-methyltetrahydropteroyltriglutamate--homocysteine S-methyltransferase [Burkholderiales bacterium]|nr:5-methyltetrahydropteroyltriglutamate--homocysteine S-methyltransferase [Burkholderiales bacterium]